MMVLEVTLISNTLGLAPGCSDTLCYLVFWSQAYTAGFHVMRLSHKATPVPQISHNSMTLSVTERVEAKNSSRRFSKEHVPVLV